MASDVYLAFGADTGDMEAGLARAQAAVRATTAEMRTLAAEMVKTGAATDSELGARLADLGSRLADAKEHVTGFKEELKGTEGEGFIGGMVEKVKDFLAPLNSLKLGLAEMGEAVAAAFAVEKIVEFIKSMGELGETTERTATILGTRPRKSGSPQLLHGDDRHRHRQPQPHDGAVRAWPRRRRRAAPVRWRRACRRSASAPRNYKASA